MMALQALKVSLGVSTVKTNRDWNWDFSICQDQLNFWNLSRLSLLTRLLFVLVKIFKIEIFELKLGQVEILVETVAIVETNRGCWDLFRFVKICTDISHFWDFLRDFRLKNLDKLRNLDQDKCLNQLTLDGD